MGPGLWTRFAVKGDAGELQRATEDEAAKLVQEAETKLGKPSRMLWGGSPSREPGGEAGTLS